MASAPAPGDTETMRRIGRTGYPAGLSCALAAPLYASTALVSPQARRLVMRLFLIREFAKDQVCLAHLTPSSCIEGSLDAAHQAYVQ